MEQTPINLYQYYTGKGQALPSVTARAPLAISAGIKGPYTGSEDQNKTLLAYLTGPQNAPGGTPAGTPAAGGATPPAGTPTGSPTGNTIADSGVRRYTSTPQPGSYEAEAASYYGGLETAAPDKNKIYQDELGRMQAQIDAINNVYAGLTAKEQEVGKTRLGQTRAVNARSGDLGGDFGNKNMADTEEFNAAKVEEINRKKSLEIAAVLGKVQDRSDAEFSKQRELSLGNQEKKLSYKKTVQEDARKDMATLAGTGISLDKLSADEYNQLLTQTGYDPLSFEAAFNGAKAASEKVDYTYHSLGNGKVLRTGKSANGKSVEEKIFDYGIPDDFAITETKSGQILLVNKATGEIKNAGNYGGGVGGAEVLSISDAKALGVPYGTTRAQAIAMNRIPGAVPPGGSDTSKTIIGLVNELLDTKGADGRPIASNLAGAFDRIVGGSVGKGRLAKNKYEQLKGLLSLENRTMLKGSGAISDFEAKTLQQAASAIGRNLSDKDFINELDKLRVALSSEGKTGGAPADTSSALKPEMGPGSVPDEQAQIDELKAQGYNDEQIQLLLHS